MEMNKNKANNENGRLECGHVNANCDLASTNNNTNLTNLNNIDKINQIHVPRLGATHNIPISGVGINTGTGMGIGMGMGMGMNMNMSMTMGTGTGISNGMGIGMSTMGIGYPVNNNETNTETNSLNYLHPIQSNNNKNNNDGRNNFNNFSALQTLKDTDSAQMTGTIQNDIANTNNNCWDAFNLQSEKERLQLEIQQLQAMKTAHSVCNMQSLYNINIPQHQYQSQQLQQSQQSQQLQQLQQVPMQQPMQQRLQQPIQERMRREISQSQMGNTSMIKMSNNRNVGNNDGMYTNSMATSTFGWLSGSSRNGNISTMNSHGYNMNSMNNMNNINGGMTGVRMEGHASQRQVHNGCIDNGVCTQSTQSTQRINYIDSSNISTRLSTVHYPSKGFTSVQAVQPVQPVQPVQSQTDTNYSNYNRNGSAHVSLLHMHANGMYPSMINSISAPNVPGSVSGFHNGCNVVNSNNSRNDNKFSSNNIVGVDLKMKPDCGYNTQGLSINCVNSNETVRNRNNGNCVSIKNENQERLYSYEMPFERPKDYHDPCWKWRDYLQSLKLKDKSQEHVTNIFLSKDQGCISSADSGNWNSNSNNSGNKSCCNDSNDDKTNIFCKQWISHTLSKQWLKFGCPRHDLLLSLQYASFNLDAPFMDNYIFCNGYSPNCRLDLFDLLKKESKFRIKVNTDKDKDKDKDKEKDKDTHHTDTEVDHPITTKTKTRGTGGGDDSDNESDSDSDSNSGSDSDSDTIDNTETNRNSNGNSNTRKVEIEIKDNSNEKDKNDNKRKEKRFDELKRFSFEELGIQCPKTTHSQPTTELKILLSFEYDCDNKIVKHSVSFDILRASDDAFVKRFRPGLFKFNGKKQRKVPKRSENMNSSSNNNSNNSNTNSNKKETTNATQSIEKTASNDNSNSNSDSDSENKKRNKSKKKNEKTKSSKSKNSGENDISSGKTHPYRWTRKENQLGTWVCVYVTSIVVSLHCVKQWLGGRCVCICMAYTAERH